MQYARHVQSAAQGPVVARRLILNDLQLVAVQHTILVNKARTLHFCIHLMITGVSHSSQVSTE